MGRHRRHGPEGDLDHHDHGPLRRGQARRGLSSSTTATTCSASSAPCESDIDRRRTNGSGKWNGTGLWMSAPAFGATGPDQYLWPVRFELIDACKLHRHTTEEFGWAAILINDVRATVMAWLSPALTCILAISLTMEVRMEVHVEWCVSLLAVAWVPSGCKQSHAGNGAKDALVGLAAWVRREGGAIPPAHPTIFE